MSTTPMVIDRFKDLATNGIRLTAGCWPNNGVLNSASHCVTTANAHGIGTIEAFDGWNEVDNTGGDWVTKWVQWQTTMYAVYHADPAWQQVPVLGSSLARAASTDQLGNQSAILDFGNLHSYPGTGLPSAALDSWIPQWDKVAAPKPHWATETGYHNCLKCSLSGVSERASGKYYTRLWFEYFNRGVVRTTAYELIDEGRSTRDRDMNWGLLRYDGSPKPQFTATKNIITLLSDPGPPFSPGGLAYTVSDGASTLHSTLLQKRDGRFYLALWQELSVWNAKTKRDTPNPTRPLTVTLPGSASLRVYAPIQSASPIQEVSGTSITVQVPDEVIVLEMIPDPPAGP